MSRKGSGGEVYSRYGMIGGHVLHVQHSRSANRLECVVGDCVCAALGIVGADWCDARNVLLALGARREYEWQAVVDFICLTKPQLDEWDKASIKETANQ